MTICALQISEIPTFPIQVVYYGNFFESHFILHFDKANKNRRDIGTN